MLEIDNQNNITLTRGDTATLTLEITMDGQSYDYSNDLVQFTVKKNTVTDSIIIQKTFSGNAVTIEPTDTESLDYQSLKYDVQVIKQSGEVYTVIPPSNFIIAPEVNFNVET